MAKDNEKLNLDEVLKNAFGGKEKKMGKIKITIHFGKDLDDAKKEKLSDMMEELSIKATDRKRYFENGGFVYPSSTMQKYDEYVSMLGDLAEVTYEEIPPTPEELATDAASKSVPDAVKRHFEENKAELKGDTGKPGDPGKDGKNAPLWPSIVISLGMALVVVLLAILWRPMPLGTNDALNAISASQTKAIDSISQRAQGAIKNIEQAETDAVAKLQGVTPPVQNPPTITPPITQTPATTTPQSGKTFEQQLNDAMSGK